MPRRVALDWERGYRLVPSRFPPRTLLDRLARPEDLELLYALQNQVNPRIRQQLGEISLVPVQERVVGPGATPIMSAFCHLNPEGSRFSDGSYGVYYAADSLQAAVAEVSHHRAVFMSSTRQPPTDIDMRAYASSTVEPLHDVRPASWDSLHDPGNYLPSQQFARGLRASGSWGIVYRSVRRPGAQCMAIFRPKAIRVPVVQTTHVTLRWNGSAIESWYEKSALHPL